MLTKCANPSCSRSFRRFGEGRLFRLEQTQPKNCNPERNAEWFWLCGECAKEVTLSVRGGVVVTMSSRTRLPPLYAMEERLCLRQAS